MVEPNTRYFTPGPRLLRLITRAHVRLYQATGGLLGSSIWQRGERGFGLLRRFDVLLLTTRGRKSGLARTVALPYFEYDGRLFVIASNGASERDPDWFTNLLARPEVEVQIGRRFRKATARVLEGEDRAAIWRRHAEAWPRWGLYQQKTSRRIPVVELCWPAPGPPGPPPG